MFKGVCVILCSLQFSNVDSPTNILVTTYAVDLCAAQCGHSFNYFDHLLLFHLNYGVMSGLLVA